MSLRSLPIILLEWAAHTLPEGSKQELTPWIFLEGLRRSS